MIVNYLINYILITHEIQLELLRLDRLELMNRKPDYD